MRGDVRMIQRRERLRFALEARQAIGIVRERIGQNLDRDLATERRVRRAIDLAHPAFADRRDDFVDAEAGAGSERQPLDYTDNPFFAVALEEAAHGGQPLGGDVRTSA